MLDYGPVPKDELDQARHSLKPFQIDTVNTVVQAMFERDQRRFLVADEVGLGKTKVARAVVAETIERLWDDESVDRIDIVYICSNSQIARQNVRDLRVCQQMHESKADRITMLPKALGKLNRSRVNLMAFTPQTSLSFGQARGRAGERAMLYTLLSHPDLVGPAVMRRRGAEQLFSLGTKKFFRELEGLADFPPPEHVVTSYRQVLEHDRVLDDLVALTDGRRRSSSDEQLTRDQRMIGRLRLALARTCIELLTPDLIILDEFQRFTEILDGDSEAAVFARQLFEFPMARTLLLSATPYRMLSRDDEDGEGHQEGFTRTVKFLLGSGQEDRLDGLTSAMRDLRRGLTVDREIPRLREARDRAQSILRDVMVRTERLAATPDRDGMLDLSRDVSCSVTTQDVASFVGIDSAAMMLGKMPSMVEYWKSAPYLFNFMDEYKVKKQLNLAWAARVPGIRSSMLGAHTLTWAAMERYDNLDTRNPRARWLIEDLDASGAFDRLWVPPAHPQTRLEGAYAHAEDFTKRLIFSGWTVAPKAVAGMVSYEYERRHHRADVTYRGRVMASRLTLPSLRGDTAERFTTLALLLPCRKLAEIGDPLRRASEHGWSLPLSLPALRAGVEDLVRAGIRPLIEQAASEGRARNIWYAGALAYLDPDILALDPSAWHENPSEGLRDHLAALQASMDDIASWGPPPVDLVDRLVDLAIAGPAICSARSLRRLAERIGDTDATELLHASARMAWAFSSFFNGPETDALISAKHDGAYWLKVLAHCASGGLSSVMDEWMHVLWDQQRLSPGQPDRLGEIAKSAAHVLSLKDGLVRVDFFDQDQDDSGPYSQTLRTHFAMRFGQARGETAEGDNPVAVRSAFNSPFRPFVLMSTSVGQEGLDFHHYAHAVVHWNLPGNPVDLEQREGRVHRYKNHAVRKNVAREHGRDPRALGAGDPWVAMFDAAQEHDGGIRPWWIHPGPASIQRLVPLLPMSRDKGRLHDLVKATTLYRMAIGQPRQAELLEVLAALPASERQTVRDAMTIDLSPNP